MKKLLTIMAVMMLLTSVMPLIVADGAGIGGGITVDVDEPTPICHEPEIYIDHTARGWNPNDQTVYTADEYGNHIPSKYAGSIDEDLTDLYSKYVVPDRQNYVFTGETMDYYVVVMDEDTDDDIASVNLYIGQNQVAPCAPVDYTPDEDAFGVNYNGADGNTYICRLIVDSTWTTPNSITIKVDDDEECDSGNATLIATGEIDWLNFNPSLAVSLDSTQINFGKVIPGETATSNAIKLKNDAEVGSGVVMDMYIASDDYFTDTNNPNSICGAGNGIRYDKFSYYATKGSINSGTNNAVEEGLGAGDGSPDREGDICESNPDEFTTLTSYSGRGENNGHIEDMCRIINTQKDASLLTQGASMSITFRLDLTDDDVDTPEECHGNFNNGQFHFVGRAV